MEPDEKWYGERSSYEETDETYIDDSIPVFDRGNESCIGNPCFGFYTDDIEDN